MITNFNVKFSDMMGGLGLLMEGSPSSYYALGGMGVAHDLLEHTPNDNGSATSELRALGSCLFIRGQGGYFDNRAKPNPGIQIAADFDINILGNPIEEAPRTHRLSPCVEEWIETAIREGTKDTAHEVSESDKKNMRAWLRIGYRQAQRRYSNYCPAYLTEVFLNIEKRVDQILRCDAEELDYYGNKVQIQVCLSDTCNPVRIRIVQ